MDNNGFDKFDDTEENTSANNTDNSKNSKKKRILLLIILFLLIFCIVIFGFEAYNKRNIKPPESTSPSLTTADSTDDEGLIDNPIHFSKLQKQNEEIYAWIKIDDTKVDYPIVQSASDDSFYLKHKAEDKSWSASGAIYTESANSKQFTDPITLIYGHNGYSDTFFTTLHYFEKEDFFSSHPYFYIYTPGHKLTYQVFSAFKYDDRHILNSFDFRDNEILADFQEVLKNPSSSVVNTRNELDTQIDRYSRIVILSTCITNQKSSRYLVCGVLVNDEKTN